MATSGDLVAMVEGLKPAGPPDRPARHQATLLLWAIGRAKQGLPRLLSWAEARTQLEPLFVALGHPGSRPTPEYPFVALAGTGWWELPDAIRPIPRAHGSLPAKWLKEHNPSGGLPVGVHDLLATDATARTEVVRALLDRFFHGHAASEVLAMTGLGDEDAVPAVTRAPAWAWDELVLACALVVENGWRELPAEDPSVIELSRLLQSLPVHPPEARGTRFRSPDSVRRKMADIATRHPESTRKHTKGGKLDLEVITAFRERPEEMRAIAELLRSEARTGEFDDLPTGDDLMLDDEGVPEGRLLERRHLRRERDPRLRKRKIKDVLARHGRLECEVCGFDFERTYGPRGAGYAECHHITPLHASGATRTRLQDLAILCANCHRMVHRGSRWLTPAELRDLVDGQG